MNWAIVLLGAFLGTTALAEPIKPGKNDACATNCQQTYAPHTSTKEISAQSVLACSQGCQLFALYQFAGKAADKGKTDCKSACGEAYKDGLIAACQSGCEHETPFTGGQMEIEVSADSPLYSYMQSAMDLHMADLFDGMDSMRSGLRGMLAPFFGLDPTASKALEQDSQKVGQPMMLGQDGHDMMMHGGGPMMMGQDGHDMMMHGRGSMMGNDPFADGSMDDMFNRMHARMQHMLKQIESELSDSSEVHEDGSNAIWNGDSTLKSVQAYEPVPPTGRHERHRMHMMDSDEQDEPSWYACFARRARRISHLSRVMVCLAMMLCIACMLFICMAIIRTAPRRRLFLATANSTQASACPYKLPPYSKVDELNADVDAMNGSQDVLVHSTPPPAYEEAGQLPEKEEPQIVA